MRRINPLLAAVASAIAIAFVEIVGAVSPNLASAPWPWVALAALVLAVGVGRRDEMAKIAAVALLVAAHAASDRRDHARESAQLASGAGQLQEFTGIVDGPVAASPASLRFTLADRRRLLVVAKRDTSPAAGPRVSPGDVVTVWGSVSLGPTYLSPGADASDERALRAGGHDGLVFAQLSDVRVNATGAPSLWRIADRLQQAVSLRVASRGGSASGNAIVRALVAGDRSAIDPDLARSLRRSGIAHLLAVSGLHLAVVSIFAFAAARRLWALLPSLAPRLASRLEAQTAAAIIALGVALLYTLVTGARPSTLRALLVAAIAFGGLATFRRATALDALGAAGLALLAFRPAILFDASFQMSMSAALVLAFAFVRRPPRAASVARRILGGARDLALVATLSLLATAPTSIGLYDELPVFGVLINIIAVPLVSLVVLPVALVGSLAGVLSPALGGVLLDGAIAVAGLIAGLAEVAANWAPPIAIPSLGIGATAALSVGLVALVVSIRGRASGSRGYLGFGVAAVCLAALAVLVASSRQRTTPADLTITFLDVGQGDGAVIEFPTGEVWLVDAGGKAFARDASGAASPGARSVIPFLRHRRIDRIDVAIISHAHPDHYWGLAAVADALPIGRLLLARADLDQGRPADLAALLAYSRLWGTSVETPPLVITVGHARASFLAPRFNGEVAVDPVSSVNDNSISLRLDFAHRSVLFSGDLEEEGESLLVASGADLDVDVVKVNHHGSRTSSWPSFVAATSPALAVISCGRRNRYGFPDPGVLARWRAVGARVLRTDLGGSVTVELTPAGLIRARSHVALPEAAGQ